VKYSRQCRRQLGNDITNHDANYDNSDNPASNSLALVLGKQNHHLPTYLPTYLPILTQTYSVTQYCHITNTMLQLLCIDPFLPLVQCSTGTPPHPDTRLTPACDR
jgi:hypothetical protein